jgi:hypothetical protein
MNDKPRHVLEQFPEKSHTIAHLMEQDPEFLTLCEDYGVCAEALLYWERSREPEAETRVNEYRTLARELLQEIIQFLRMAK